MGCADSKQTAIITKSAAVSGYAGYKQTAVTAVSADVSGCADCKQTAVVAVSAAVSGYADYKKTSHFSKCGCVRVCRLQTDCSCCSKCCCSLFQDVLTTHRLQLLQQKGVTADCSHLLTSLVVGDDVSPKQLRCHWDGNVSQVTLVTLSSKIPALLPPSPPHLLSLIHI